MKKAWAFFFLAACLVGSVEAAEVRLQGGLAGSWYPYQEAVNITGRVISSPEGTVRGALMIGFPYGFHCFMRQISSLVVTPGNPTTTVALHGIGTCQDQNQPPFEAHVSLDSQHSTDSSELISANLVLVAPDGERGEFALVPIQQLSQVKP